MTNQELFDGISALSNELMDIAKTLAKLEPVSHLSKSPIRWNGGIIGVIQDVRENNRLMKLINAPIYGEKSFYNLVAVIAEDTAKMVKMQKEMVVDESFTKENLQEIATNIVKAAECAHYSWLQYSPEMAHATIKVGGEEGALEPTLNSLLKEELKQLDLPQEYAYLKKQETSESSGCLSIFILGLISTIGMVGAGCYYFIA